MAMPLLPPCQAQRPSVRARTTLRHRAGASAPSGRYGRWPPQFAKLEIVFNKAPGSLPKDARLAGLWADKVAVESREAVLPGTEVEFRLVLEGNSLRVVAAVQACLVVAKDRRGYVFHIEFPLDSLGSAEHQIITLFIAKGRGEPHIDRGAA